jgi:hypothetical protein
MRLSRIHIAAMVCAFSVLTVGRLEAAKNPKTKRTTTAEQTVDLNTASRADLEKLPGVGRAAATKIISHRPYNSINDLSKAGIPQKTIDQIRPMVTAGSTPAPKETTTTREHRTHQNEPRTDNAGGTTPDTGTATSGSTKVWVNTDSGIFHVPGDRFYGKTKHGKYMTEDEALKAGYRQAKHR